MIEDTRISWKKIYDIDIIAPGDIVLFRRGVSPKNKTDVCCAIKIGNHIEIVSASAGWSKKLGLFTNLGVLLDDGDIMGSIVRVGKITLPLWANHKPKSN